MEEQKLQEIINSSPFGFAHHEIILDRQNKPFDYRFIEVNQAFEKLTGLEAKTIIGKTVREVLPGIEKADFSWIGFYGKVALEGGNETFEQFSEPLNRWYQVNVYSSEKGFFATSFTDITKRKQAEEALLKQNLALSNVNQFSIELSMLSPEENIEAYISKKIKEISGAKVALFNEYDAIAKTNSVLHIEMEPGRLEKVVGLIGKPIKNIQSPISDEMYKEIISERIGYRKTLYEASFGAISRPVGSAIQAMLNVDRFIGLAYVLDGNLYGTTLLAMGRGMPDPPREILEHFINLAALSLKRKKAEDALRGSEEKFKNIFEGNIAPMFLIDADNGNLVDVNEAAVKFYGWSRDEMRRININQINMLPPEEIKKEMAKARSSRRVYYEFQHRKADNSFKDVEVFGSRIEIEGKEYMHSIVHDITEKKKAERVLIEQKELLSAIYRNAPLIIMALNSERRIQQVNGFATQFAGRDAEEMHGLRGGEALRCMHVLDNPAGCGFGDFCQQCVIRNTVLDTLESGETHLQIEAPYSFKKKAGQIQEMTLLTSTTPIMVKGERMVMVTLLDITERKQAEEALSESKAKYHTLVQHLNEGLMQVDLDDRILFVNQRLCEIFGYNEAELIGKIGYKTIILEEDQKIIKEKNQQRKNISYERYEIRGKKKSGETIWIDISGSAVKDEKGNTIGSVGLLTDITERKEAEEALKSNYALLQIAGETARFGGWSVDLEKNTATWSDAVADIHEVPHGYAPPVEEGVNFYAPEWREKITQVFNDCAQKGISYDEEMEIITSKGKRLWVRTNGRAERDENGKIIRVQGSFQDITERKLADKRLKEKQTYLDLILKATNTHFNILDSEFNLIYVDSGWQKIYGEPDGSKCYDYFMGQKKACSSCGIPKALKTKKTIVTEEFLPKENRYYEVHTIPLQNEQGQWICAEFNIDITERKRAGKRILEAERLSAIGELSSGVAHDFNNALQGILGNLELALIDNIPPETRKFIETAKKSAQDAASRVRLLQRFAKNKTGQEEHEPINIKDIIDDSIAQTRTLWKDEAQKDGLTFDLRTHYQENVMVMGNSGDLRSVLYNIIKNSIQAMPKGGTIDISTRREGEKVYLSVADTGIGMDEETAKKIFQPFYTTKGFDQGKGLGMSGVYTIIKEHKGAVYVKKTKPGNGTEIELMLPYCEPEKSREEKKKEYSGIAKILWVDDQKMIRRYGEKMISMMGHEIDVASSGKEALDLLATKQYDLMITDIGMPNMSGWQLTEKIKGKYPKMKIAVVTGWGDDVDAEQKTKHGVGYVLGKPVDMEKLKNLIGEVLQMKTS